MHPLEQTQSATVAQAEASALTRNDEKPTRFPTGIRWPDIDALYTAYEGEREIYDILGW